MASSTNVGTNVGSSSEYDPNKLGWGAALITCVMTAGLAFTAYTIHTNTYRHPRDPMFQQVYHDAEGAGHGEGAAAGEASHGAAAEEHGDHAAPAAEAKGEAKGEAKH
jgi:hypothetical protein